ncbi:MAG TPA: FtsQ-type POTRA domain-containing protein [Ardenticatenaceae bacterium]|nr:FtsQ-type POTRA domain-containing protein [Ardenticatenaceae bacterium]
MAPVPFMRRRPRRRSQRLEAYRALLPELTMSPRARSAVPWPVAILSWLRAQRIALALLVVFSGLGYWFFGTDQFYVYGAHITGTVNATPQELYSALQLEGLSIFWVNAPSLERALEQNPLIEQAVVTAHLPNRVHIRVVERRPVAVWQSGDQSLFVDRTGKLFPLRGDASQALVICDLRTTPIEAGDQADVEAVLTALELAKFIPERHAFDWEPAAGVSFVTDGGWRVSFGDHLHLPLKASAYRAFLQQVAPTAKIELLDLSAPQHPYYRVIP